MRSVKLWAMLLLAVCAGMGSAWAQTSPVAAVEAIYATYDEDDADPNYLTPALYSERLQQLIARMHARCAGKEHCGPDFDYFVNGSDFDIKNLEVRETGRANGAATVEAKFLNGTKKQAMTFRLVEESGRWVVDGLTSASGYDIDTLLTVKD